MATQKLTDRDKAAMLIGLCAGSMIGMWAESLHGVTVWGQEMRKVATSSASNPVAYVPDGIREERLYTHCFTEGD